MGLDSLNKRNVSRRDILTGAGALAVASALNTPAANAMPSAETPAPLGARPESIPTLESVTEEEVRSVLGKLLGNTGYKEMRKREDGDGLYLLEVAVPQEGGHIEYLYRRGRPEKEELPDWRIDMTFYDEVGMPISGSSVAQKIEGTWKLTP